MVPSTKCGQHRPESNEGIGRHRLVLCVVLMVRVSEIEPSFLEAS